MSTQISFIVPFHRGLADLERCVRALVPVPSPGELVIVADGAEEDCQHLVRACGARLVDISGTSGPAVARNLGAAAAAGDVLVFIDADVVVSRASIERLSRLFDAPDAPAAVFGAYDDRPDDQRFMSQYKNLSHSFIHHSGERQARTFWAGFGAVRRDAFRAVGGFDERFGRPSVEDIDLGYRLNAAGYDVVLDPALSACHLKRWTLRSAIASDVLDRGIPWTQLLFRYGAMHNDLNLRVEYRLSVVLAYLALGSVAFAAYEPRAVAVAALALGGLTVLNRRYYRYFHRKRGALFTAGVWALHFLQHVCNGLSFVAGAVLFYSARYLGVRLPGALPTTISAPIPARAAR